MGSAITATARKKPPISLIRGIRLWSGIVTEIEFAFGHVAERSREHDPNAYETGKTDNSNAQIRAGEVGPGFHVICFNCIYYS